MPLPVFGSGPPPSSHDRLGRNPPRVMIVCQVPLSLSSLPLCFFFLCFSSLFFGSSCLLSFSSLFFIIVGTCSLRKIEKATGRTVQRPPMLRKFWSGEAQPKLGCPRYIEGGVVFEGFDNCAGTSVRSVALSLSLSRSLSFCPRRTRAASKRIFSPERL